LAHVHGAYGDVFFRLGRIEEARPHYQDPLARLKEVAARRPGSFEVQEVVARTYARLGQLAFKLGQRATSEKAFVLALNGWEHCVKLARENRPERLPWYQPAVAVAQARSRHFPEAEKEAHVLLEQWPDHPEVRLQVARCYALCLATTDKTSQQRCATRALDLLRQAADQGYRNVVALETDPEWELLQNQADFAALVKRIKGMVSQDRR